MPCLPAEAQLQCLVVKTLPFSFIIFLLKPSHVYDVVPPVCACYRAIVTSCDLLRISELKHTVAHALTSVVITF